MRMSYKFFFFKDLIVDYYGERRDDKRELIQEIYGGFRVFGFEFGVQKFFVVGVWCLFKFMRIGLCWLYCQIFRCFFKVWMICLK